ncbi:MAG: hypothetical protein ACYDCO_20480 [Armatimonadota bacterium]
MPFIGAIIAFILRSLGRILAFLFGWAIIRFFGEMPSKKKYLLFGIALLSIAAKGETSVCAASLRQLRSSFTILAEKILGLFGFIRRRRRYA